MIFITAAVCASVLVGGVTGFIYCLDKVTSPYPRWYHYVYIMAMMWIVLFGMIVAVIGNG